MGSKLSSVQKLFTQGDYEQTDNAFDWAIEGDGFFQMDNGSGTTVYSRAGNFKVDQNGNVCNSAGLKLIPNITVPTDTATFTIDSGGTWTCQDSTGKSLSTGRLQIARFVNPAGLTSMGMNLYDVSDASGAAIVGLPGVSGYGTISQNYLELSNVNSIDEMVNMIESLLAYELNSKAIQTADQMLQTVGALKR